MMGKLSCPYPPPATIMWSRSAGIGEGWGEPGLPLTLWICPHPREVEEKEEEKEAARGLHDAGGKRAGASVAGGRGQLSCDRALRPRAALPRQLCSCQCHEVSLVANEAGAEVLGRACWVCSPGTLVWLVGAGAFWPVPGGFGGCKVIPSSCSSTLMPKRCRLSPACGGLHLLPW